MIAFAVIFALAATALDIVSTLAFERASGPRARASEFWWYRWLGAYWLPARIAFGVLAAWASMHYQAPWAGIGFGIAWTAVAVWNFRVAAKLRRLNGGAR